MLPALSCSHRSGLAAAGLMQRRSTVLQDAALRNAIEQACRKRFIDGEGADIEAQLLAVAKEARLDAQAVSALREVIAIGFRPLPNEE